jgi:hypothetical protein
MKPTETMGGDNSEMRGIKREKGARGKERGKGKRKWKRGKKRLDEGRNG